MDPRRDDPANALSRGIRQTVGLDGAQQSLQSYIPTDEHEQLLRTGSAATDRGLKLKLPALRSQHEYGWEELRRGHRCNRA